VSANGADIVTVWQRVNETVNIKNHDGVAAMKTAQTKPCLYDLTIYAGAANVLLSEFLGHIVPVHSEYTQLQIVTFEKPNTNAENSKQNL
jgi:hypothetical protein